jgi:hypothetical protein
MELSHIAVCAAAAGLLLGACGESEPAGSAPPGGPVQLTVALQNSELLVGVDRINIALFDTSKRPISGATATVDIQQAGASLGTRPLQDIGAEYGNIPIYVGAARFPQVGAVTLVVRAALKDGRKLVGQTNALVTNKAGELPVGYTVPALKQSILGDPGVKIIDIDSGVPPDTWHSTTIADGLAQHRPMVLYFGEPGFCKSRTCGPTVQVLQQLAQQVGDRLLFEHIEDHFPAGPDETSKDNPAFDAFGLKTDPWIYFVTRSGIVSDRFEGPVTVEELRGAADGTLAGRVPAVDIPAGG